MRGLAGALLIVVSTSCFAASPYAGQERRAIKSLSEREVQDLLAGKGMGLAKTAELNHYPGPLHVLELATPLGLSEEQKVATQLLFNTMQKRAIEQGNALLDLERELDQAFAKQAIDSTKLNGLMRRIGIAQAELRQIHLEAHLVQREMLTEEQLRRYDHLRGYDGRGGSMEHRGHKH